MRAIDYDQNSCLCKFLGKVFLKILSLFGRGMSLGFVLFVALSALSLLNRGMDSFESAFKRSGVTQGPQFGTSGYSGVGLAPASYGVKRQPQTSGTTSRFGKAQDTRDVIRESGYFVSAAESFTRSLSRFSK